MKITPKDIDELKSMLNDLKARYNDGEMLVVNDPCLAGCQGTCYGECKWNCGDGCNTHCGHCCTGNCNDN